MKTNYSEEEKAFIERHSYAVLSMCNNRNLITADYVVFREYKGGLNMELFKDEHWAKLSMHKQADVIEERLFFIPRLAIYFYEKGSLAL